MCYGANYIRPCGHNDIPAWVCTKCPNALKFEPHCGKLSVTFAEAKCKRCMSAKELAEEQEWQDWQEMWRAQMRTSKASAEGERAEVRSEVDFDQLESWSEIDSEEAERERKLGGRRS
jgi:hypothetical protein